MSNMPQTTQSDNIPYKGVVTMLKTKERLDRYYDDYKEHINKLSPYIASDNYLECLTPETFTRGFDVDWIWSAVNLLEAMDKVAVCIWSWKRYEMYIDPDKELIQIRVVLQLARLVYGPYLSYRDITINRSSKQEWSHELDNVSNKVLAAIMVIITDNPILSNLDEYDQIKEWKTKTEQYVDDILDDDGDDDSYYGSEVAYFTVFDEDNIRVIDAVDLQFWTIGTSSINWAAKEIWLSEIQKKEKIRDDVKGLAMELLEVMKNMVGSNTEILSQIETFSDLIDEMSLENVETVTDVIRYSPYGSGAIDAKRHFDEMINR